MSGPPQYPGPDPAGSNDPFDRPPDESGERRAAAAGGWTGGSTGSSAGDGTEPTAPIAPDQVGYWERKAAEDQAARDAQRTDPPPSSGGWASPAHPVPYGEPSDTSTPPSPASPPPPYGEPSPYSPYPPSAGASGYYSTQQPHPQSTTALVLGLVGLVGGLVCCLPLVVAPFAWVVGGRAKREIDASNGQLGGRGNAQAGYVMGIIGTVLVGLVVLALVVLVIGIVAFDDAGYTNF